MHTALFLALVLRAITDVLIRNNPDMEEYSCKSSSNNKTKVDLQTKATQYNSTQSTTATINSSTTPRNQPDPWNTSDFYSAEVVLFALAVTMAIIR